MSGFDFSGWKDPYPNPGTTLIGAYNATVKAQKDRIAEKREQELRGKAAEAIRTGNYQEVAALAAQAGVDPTELLKYSADAPKKAADTRKINVESDGEVAKQLAPFARNFRSITDPEQRRAYLRANRSTLLAKGAAPEVLDAIDADPMNPAIDSTLQAYAEAGYTEELRQDDRNTQYDNETKRWKEQHPTVSEGSTLVDYSGATPTPVYRAPQVKVSDTYQVEIPGIGGGAAPQTTPQNYGPVGAPQGAVQTVLSGALPAPVVAGFMGNFDVEGGYGGALGDGGSASGIAQWRKERRDNFRRMYGVDPHQASHEQQAQFVLWEMQNPRAAGMTVEQRDAILAARTPEEAADLIDRYYERSNGAHRRRRIQYASRYASQTPAPAPEQAPAPQAPAAPQTQVAGLPEGARQIGTYQGRPVYELPDGRKIAPKTGDTQLAAAPVEAPVEEEQPQEIVVTGRRNAPTAASMSVDVDEAPATGGGVVASPLGLAGASIMGPAAAALAGMAGVSAGAAPSTYTSPSGIKVTRFEKPTKGSAKVTYTQRGKILYGSDGSQKQAIDPATGQPYGKSSGKAPAAKDVHNMRMKDRMAARIDAQLDRLEAIERSGGILYSGPILGRVPDGIKEFDAESSQYNSIVARVRKDIQSLTRIPGVGSTSDYEARLEAATIPSLSQNEKGRSESIRQLRLLIADIRREAAQYTRGAK